mgnify:CR=1 FL=1
MAGQIKRYDPDLAAALFVTLGGNLPNRFDREEEAQSLAQKLPNREQRLKYIIELCARPDSPQTRYLTAKAYSWLGDAYRREIIRFCTEYLEGEPWSALPRGTVVEDGITIYRPARERASVLMDLAQAQDADGRHSAALASFLEAYRLEPYNPMPAIKAAGLVERLHGKEEAINFLNQQKSSVFYQPVKYTDAQGNTRRNDSFRHLLDGYLRKLQSAD